jgi:hypothetical protein
MITSIMTFTSLLLIFVSIGMCSAIFRDFNQSLKQVWFQLIHKLVNFLSSYGIVNKPLIISIDGNIGSGKYNCAMGLDLVDYTNVLTTNLNMNKE